MPGYNAAAPVRRTLLSAEGGGAMNIRVAESVDKILYRVEEAAELLSISRTATFGLIKSGNLQTVKIGGRRRISRNAIENYVSRLVAEAAEDVL